MSLVIKHYDIKVWPARLGFHATVGMQTWMEGWEATETMPAIDGWWLGWTPEPHYWRPTRAWALRRGVRKKNKMLKKDARLAKKEIIPYGK